MYEYKCTDLSFGLGFQKPSTRSRCIDEHLQVVASQGWRLTKIHHLVFEFPLTWRFFWERPASENR